MDAGGTKTATRGPVGPKKQLGFYLPRADWLRLRNYSAKRGLPIAGVFLERLQPLLDELRRREAGA